MVDLYGTLISYFILLFQAELFDYLFDLCSSILWIFQKYQFYQNCLVHKSESWGAVS